MATVWSTANERPPVGGAEAGDLVVRVSGDSVVFGRVQGNEVRWLAESVSASTLAAGALDGVSPGEDLTAVAAPTALELAAEGVESALDERGG